MNELHANPVADVESLKVLNQPPFNRGMEKAYPHAFRCCTRNDAVELLPDPRLQKHGGCRFLHLPLYFFPRAELANIYGGLDPEKETIVYCQNGARSVNEFFVLKGLGFKKVRVYMPSWAEWGSRVDLPADNVTYFNFMSILERLSKLDKQKGS
jgi:rhodanese-related sulfurtransferase